MNPVIICPECGSATEKKSGAAAQEAKERHNERRHGGDEVADFSKNISTSDIDDMETKRRIAEHLMGEE